MYTTVYFTNNTSLDVFFTTQMSCPECLRSSAPVKEYCNQKMCLECSEIVLKYYRSCTACDTGKISPAVSTDIALCPGCMAPGMSDVPTFPCRTTGCRGTVDAKWKTTCLACYKKSLATNTTQASTFPCSVAGCKGTTTSKYRPKCLDCFKARR